MVGRPSQGGKVALPAYKTINCDCLPVSVPRQFANDAEGIAALVDLLKDSGVGCIVLEATGGYETAVASALAVAKLPVAVVNPKQVRDFAKATGLLAKTDRLDAALLALFAERIRPPLRALPDEAQRALADLLGRRNAVDRHARAGEGAPDDCNGGRPKEYSAAHCLARQMHR